MLSRIFAVILLISSFSAKAQPEKKVSDYRVKIEIPASWIKKAKNYDYKQNNSSLLKEFDNIIKPLSIDTGISHRWDNLEKSKDSGGFFNPMFVDLDEDPGEELICLLGWDEDRPSIAVFKKMGNKWYLLYLESFYMWYSTPDLYVANTFSRNKTFYFRRLYDRGSGIYADGYGFYRLVHNKVYHCLELVDDAHLYLDAMSVLQTAKLNLKFDRESDAVTAIYAYSFSLGGIDGCGNSYCDPLPILNDSKWISYHWDNRRMAYKADAPLPELGTTTSNLTEQQVACFGAFGADSLFASAFRNEIQNLIKTGTSQQKKQLKKFLQDVKEKK